MGDDAVSAGAGDDGVLTAYLDGELAGAERAALEARLLAEPALKARLDHLGRGGQAFGEAYAALLAAAPADRLQAMFTDLAATHAGRRGARTGDARRLLAIAAALVIFAAGAAVGHLLTGAPGGVPAEVPGWRQVVAEYQSLTTADTLAAIAESPAAVSGELAAVGGRLALDLSPDKLVLPDVALKRAQLYEFRGMPLAQVAYLSPESGPIALCIINNGRPDAPPAFEQREGHNIVFWTVAGRGYMLIGKAPRETLEAYAGALQSRIS